MLTRIEIDGFKSFRNFELDVPPFLVIIGRNAAGKSNLFDAIQFLAGRWVDRADQLVTVVPVRETEAWLLADGQALRDALGVRWSDAEMGLPASPRDVERVADPKRVLNDVTGRVSRSMVDHLVPAYRRWWEDTRNALQSLGYRPG